MSPWPGIGISLGLGRNGGLFVSHGTRYFHVGLFWFAITLWRLDTEAMICDLIHKAGDDSVREARIAELEAENARLEALILQINDDLGRTWDTGLVEAEALRIRSKG